MYHELRTYTCMPGKLPALQARFRNHTLALWKTHNIKPLAFWTTVYGVSNQQLIYMLEWTSLDERERVWAEFLADPAWHKVRAESEADGPIISNVSNELLVPTDFSAIR